MAQWRRFAFFQRELVEDANKKPWLKGVNITGIAANRGTIVAGDAEGALHMSDRQFNARKFQAYEHFVSHVAMLKKMNLLVTVGDGIDPRDSREIKRARKVAEAARRGVEHELHVPAGDVRNSTALVKVWRTDQMDREGRPKLLQQIRIFAKYPEEAVTAFAVSNDLGYVAVGLKNGAVILFRSDLKRRGDQRPPVLLQPAAKYPVTYLAFTETEEPEKKTNALFLYAATRRGLMSYHCSLDDSKGASPPQRAIVLDERGVSRNCAAVNDQGDIAVGQSDAVYFYSTEDRGVCFGFDGEKRYLNFFKHYLLVTHIDPRGRQQINVYDLKNKFIAFNWTLTSSSRSRRDVADEMEEVRFTVAEFGALFVVSSMGTIYRLTEKDTASKLDILFRKNLFAIAISLAFSSNYDINNIVDIFRMYGDHLYAKGEYDAAIRQYNRTIGHIEPSYVIRRFLDAQQIHNLAAYLEELHAKSFANSEHTTLLLNCFTKLKDVTKLDKFLGIETMDSLTFDVETAISVLRTNYPQHALSLAKKHKEHSWYLKIQLDHISYVDSEEALKPAERQRLTDALEYITSLPFSEAESSLKKYGRTLVTHLPQETTEVLKLLCTGRYDTSSGQRSDPSDFIHLYVAHPHHLRGFLDFIVAENNVKPSKSVGNTLLELVLQDPDQESRALAVMDVLDNPRMAYDDDHALILVQMHEMKRGELYLYEKLHMYQMVVQYHMEMRDDRSVIEQVKKHGEKDPSLWLLALKYFSERKASDKYLKDILRSIDMNIPPLQVVQALSQSKRLPLSVVREFILKRFQQDDARLAEDREEIEKFKQDTNRMRLEIEEMQSKAVVFKSTKCDLCNHELDPPSVHFMCKHSFHQSCLPEYEMECQTCAPDHRHVLHVKQSLEQKAGNHEQFFTQLESSTDGFKTIAEFFGKGIFASNSS